MSTADYRYKVVYPDHRDPDLSLERSIYDPAGVRVELLNMNAVTLDVARYHQAMEDADAIVTSTVFVDPAALAHAPKLKIAVRMGVGYEQLDLDALAAHGAYGCNIPDYGSEEVALHALTVGLALRRKLFALDAEVRSGGWRYRPAQPVHRLSTQTVGVVGIGRIGGEFVKRAKVLYGRVIAHDPYVPAARFADLGAESVSLDDLLRQSDVISLHVPLTPETTHLIGERELRLMKSNAVLVTTCRGKVVDQLALAQALNAGWIEGAGCDVWETEPLPLDHPLLRCQNLIASPHAAFYSEEGRRDMRVRAAEEVVRVLRGEAPHYPLNSPRLSASAAPV